MDWTLSAASSLRWAPHCGPSGGGPGPQHGQHGRGSAQHRRDPGGIRLSQVGQPTKTASLLLVELPAAWEAADVNLEAPMCFLAQERAGDARGL